jgi:hypothetical protein
MNQLMLKKRVQSQLLYEILIYIGMLCREFSDEEIKVSSLHRVKRKVRVSIITCCSFASFFQMLFYFHHLDPFNITYPKFYAKYHSSIHIIGTEEAI